MIEVQHLSKIYGSNVAIQDISFSVAPGQIVGLLGPNGAGKTTTMRILAGYLPATAGTAIIAGYDVHQNPMQVRKRIGYLPEIPPLYPDLTVEGYLYFVARIKGVSWREQTRAIYWAMEKCNLIDKRFVLIHKLSKGYKQRVGIAQAIVHNPSVIILDEPTVGLDPRQIIEVRNLIKGLGGDHTIILSSHILPEVSMTCSQVTIINKGKVVATNSPENLKAQLAGGSGYEIELEGEIEAARKLIQVIPGVKLVEPIESSDIKGDRCQLRVLSEPGRETGRDLAAVLVGSGIGIYEMRRIRATLEDVFLELTTSEKIMLDPISSHMGSDMGLEQEIVVDDEMSKQDLGENHVSNIK